MVKLTLTCPHLMALLFLSSYLSAALALSVFDRLSVFQALLATHLHILLTNQRQCDTPSHCMRYLYRFLVLYVLRPSYEPLVFCSMFLLVNHNDICRKIKSLTGLMHDSN